jgi:hypothetical protein
MGTRIDAPLPFFRAANMPVPRLLSRRSRAIDSPEERPSNGPLAQYLGT